jgi:hypothetical protein
VKEFGCVSNVDFTVLSLENAESTLVVRALINAERLELVRKNMATDATKTNPDNIQN